jgi:pimeloyl-ACP methyl ester carboxylesterase
MFEPYQPGKIPVVMVHGLLASPLAWTNMFNDLRADQTLRKHYQFWFYLYPTANPYLATAADLRRRLNELRAELDPERRDPSLDQMVFVGHSMGGLVSKLLTVDGGDDFFALVSPKPFSEIRLASDTRSELEPIFMFQRQPFVRRVVFIATPHHGSNLSPTLAGKLVDKFIQLPKNFMTVTADLTKENPDLQLKLQNGRVPTSVDLLAPGAPALELLAARPKPAGVHYHSIIGETCGKGLDGSDGVVTVRSAHLDGVDSEIIIQAGHTSIHDHPRAVLEVWRILQEHLHDVRGEDAGPIPLEVLPPLVAPPSTPILGTHAQVDTKGKP